MLKLDKVELRGFKSFYDETEVAFPSAITAIVGPNGCGKCIDGNTLVTLADGRDIPIRELVEAAFIHSRQVETLDDGWLTHENPHNIWILSLNPATLRLEPRSVTAFVKRKTTPFLLRIRTRTGREITATPYHPLFTLEDRQLRPLKAEEVKVGVRLALPRRLPVSGGQVELSPLEAVKQFHADDAIFVPPFESLRAWAHQARTKFGTWTDLMRAAGISAMELKGVLENEAVSTTVLRSLRRAAEIPPPLDGQLKARGHPQMRLPLTLTPDVARFLGLLIAEARNTRSNQVRFVSSDPSVNDEYQRLAQSLFGVRVYRSRYKPLAMDSLISSCTLCEALERLFGFSIDSSSAEKEVPPQLFESDAQTQWAFLSGLFEGDAYLSVASEANDRPSYIEYVTASPKLAAQVVGLLLRLDVFALLRRKQEYAANTEEGRCRTYYSVLIYGHEQLRYVAQNLSFIGEKRHHLEALRQLPVASDPDLDLIPGVTPRVKRAARRAEVNMKTHCRNHTKLAAYIENRCEVSRSGLLEVVDQIERLGAWPELVSEELDQLKRLATSDIYWDEIISVEKVAPIDDWVYDLSIAGTHNFVAGNMIVHNSNIADGVTWVLGEQSARSLRGTRMEDVIFQGSHTRPALGMAEVVLTLRAKEDIHLSSDGTDGDPLAQDNGDESRRAKKAKLTKKIQAGSSITVARRLYRSGESEYLIDGKRVRLRDVYDLFAGTGLGPGHYAIIGQDRVAEIVNAKPYERRSVIEEAAGITKFRLRQRSIEARLESSKQNLLRLNDIIAEIERQVGSLKRQAARARRCQRLREELRAWLRIFFRLEYQRIDSELAAVEEQFKTLEGEKARLEAEMARVEADHREAVHSGRSSESVLAAARDHLANVELELDRARNRKAHCYEQVSDLRARRQELQREERALVERAEVIAAEVRRLHASLEQLSAEVGDDQQRLSAEERLYFQQVEQAKGKERELETLRIRFADQINTTANLRNACHQLDEALRRMELQIKGLSTERERASSRRAHVVEEGQQLEGDIAAHRLRVEFLKEEKERLLAALEEARSLEASEKADLSEAEKKRIALENRLQSLVELDERHAYYSHAVQYLFDLHSQHPSFRLLGTLADSTNVEPADEKMVEAFFGERLQAILVPSVEDARRAIEALEPAEVGRAQFLVIGGSGGQESTGAEGHGSDESELTRRSGRLSFMQALGLNSHLVRVVARAFPECETAEIVADLERAIEQSLADPSKLFVTRKGEWARGGCLLSGGADSEKAIRLLTVKREIKELSIQLKELVRAIEEAERKLAARSRAIEALEEEVRGLEGALQNEEKALLEKELRFSEHEREAQRIEQQLRVIEFEQAEAERELARISDERAHLGADLQKAEAGLRLLEAEYKNSQDEIAHLRRTVESLAEGLSTLRIQLAARGERKHALISQIRRLENEHAEINERLRRISQEGTRIATELEELERAVRELDVALESLEASRTQAEARLNQASTRLTEAHQASDALEERLNQMRQSESELRDRLGQLEVARAQLVIEAKYLNESCVAELAQSLEELMRMAAVEEPRGSESVDQSNTQAVKSWVEGLRRKIEEIGPVNMMALEELQQSEERLAFLKAQREDVEKSIASAEEALREIKRRSRQRFIEAFEAINENFTEMFRELFGGGQGQMVLLDPENVLESGIDIIAQPPGKRLQNIQLLSGGEKAMTALSLLLAIFRYRPSPFCILDEVDAPLDDVNIRRFSAKIVEMSKQTQFILITHNKETMESAEVLYGVTMEEPGVSKLVSVRLK